MLKGKKLTFENMNLSNLGTEVIAITGALYVKTPEALATLQHELHDIGYKMKNCREDKHDLERGVTAEQKEKNGWSLWFATIDVRSGKCGSCKKLISTLGIKRHGHTCEHCGAVTYLDIIDGTTVRFSFIHKDGDNNGMADLRLKAKRWDTEAGFIYFYPEIIDGLWSRGERAKLYLDSYKDRWDEVTEGDQKLIKIKHELDWSYDTAVISLSETSGHYHNHDIVNVWKGKEYSEWADDFPVADTISIYETWHWAPWPKNKPDLHEKIFSAAGMVSRCDYYYQDGRQAFYDVHLERMRIFVEHFTQLDVNAWDAMVQKAPRSGPGFIRAVAAFCQGKDQPVVRDEPNIGSMLAGYGKMFSDGFDKLTSGDLESMNRASKDPTVMGEFADLLKTRVAEKNRTFTTAFERRIRSSQLSMTERRQVAEKNGYRVHRRYRGVRQWKRLVAIEFWNPQTDHRVKIPATQH